MKELSIEEKAKAYDKVIERAKKLHGETGFDYVKITLETILPELAESEDESIRKHIVTFLMECDKMGDAPSEVAEWLAWLEKHKDYVSPQMVADAYLRGCNDTENKLLKQFDKC